MFFKLFFLFVTVPLVELALLLYLGSRFGIVATLLLVVITGLLGAYFAKLQGTLVLRRIRDDVAQGRMPTEAMIDGMLIFFAGVLLMMPGVLSDITGIVLLTPLGRQQVKFWAVAWFKRHFKIEGPTVRGASDSENVVIDSYVVDGKREDSPTRP